MRDILVYVTDKEQRAVVENRFMEGEFHAAVFDDPELALEACSLELFDLAVIWAAVPKETEAFIEALREQQLDYIPVVAVFDSPGVDAALNELALVDLFPVPMDNQTLFHLLTTVIRDVDPHGEMEEGMNWQGNLSEYNLVDLIQMLEAGERDAELRLRYRKNEGVVLFHQGRLVTATLGNLRGMTALGKMVLWHQGQFETKLVEVGEVDAPIGMDNADLMMLLIGRLLRQNQALGDLPDLDSEVVRNPLFEGEKLSDFQDRLANFCLQPLSIFELLLRLEEDNETILPELKGLMDLGVVGLRADVEQLLREAEEQKGLGKFFSSISGLFKKKEPVWDENWYYREEEPETPEGGEIEVSPLLLSNKDLSKIEDKVERHYR
ncbi:MAG TPA: DUF4388 domain-containing protein [Calditrichia bacterium]|nr:DUF4388 domain-containing protein [Calditrichia bacterium]